MKKSRPLSIRHTLWLAIALTVASTVVGTSGLHGYHLYRQAVKGEEFRVETIAETYAAEAAPLLSAGRTGELAAFIQQLPLHPAAVFVAILDHRQQPMASRGPADLLEQYVRLTQGYETGADPRNWYLPENVERGLPALNLVAVRVRVTGHDQPLGTLLCAGRLVNHAMIGRQAFWMLFVYPMLIAATGMLLGFLWLRRKVLDPLALLSVQSHKGPPAGLADHLPVDRADEIGELARTLTDMHLSLEEWQTKAARLERSFTNRVAMETERITRELRRAETKIWTDPLTGLGNRRMLDDKFVEIFNAQRDSQKDLSIVMIDIDHFKTLNDTLGHSAGDELLRFIGQLLRQCLREQDLAVRHGGDEFLVVLPSVPLDRARTIAERTMALFNQQARLLPVRPRPSMSAGLASLHQHRPGSSEALLQMADAALYQAKAAGKNRCADFSTEAQAATAR